MTNTLRGPRSLWGLSFGRVLGIVLVPLVIAGVFLWGLWDPTERLQNVTAAVVNLDEPVEVEGQLTPLGRVLAAELIGTSDDEQNFEWVLTDEDDADEGLDDGRYITVVTIPKNFSRAATSLSEGPDSAEQANIDIETSDRSKLLDAALSAAVTQTATRVLNEQLGSAFVGNVFVGFNELGEGIGEVRDGAQKLADGSAQLSQGIGEFATGTEELAGGVNQLSGGAYGLAAGAQQSADGAWSLAQGMNEFASGANDLAIGASQAADGSAELAAGVRAYVGPINSVLNPIQEEIILIKPQLEKLKEDIQNETIPLPPELDIDGVVAAINQLLATPELLGSLIAGGESLVTGAQLSADGSSEIATGIADIADGAYGLAGGTNDLAGGLGELAAGANELAAGTGALSEQMPGLVDGANQLADGAEQSAGGSQDLADGLGSVVDGIPRYTEDQRDKLSELAVTPVVSEGDSSALFSGSGAPLFTSIALWAGALASFLLFIPLWARTRQAAMSEAMITLKSSLLSLGIGATQGILVGIAMTFVLSLDPRASLGFITLATLTGVVFSLINQGLVALMGGYGRFASLVLMTAAFVAGIVSTAPQLLRTLSDFSPIGAAINGFQSIASGSANYGGIFSLLVVWALLGLVLIGAAVHRKRKNVD